MASIDDGVSTLDHLLGDPTISLNDLLLSPLPLPSAPRDIVVDDYLNATPPFLDSSGGQSSHHFANPITPMIRFCGDSPQALPPSDRCPAHHLPSLDPEVQARVDRGCVGGEACGVQ